VNDRVAHKNEPGTLDHTLALLAITVYYLLIMLLTTQISGCAAYAIKWHMIQLSLGALFGQFLSGIYEYSRDSALINTSITKYYEFSKPA